MRPYESSRRDEKSKKSLHHERSQEVGELIGVRDFFIGESLASDIRALDSKEEVIKRKDVHRRRIKNIEKYRPLLDRQTSEGTMSSAILWVKDYKLEVMRTRKQIMKMNNTKKPTSPASPNKAANMFPSFSPSGGRRQEDEHFVYKVAIDNEVKDKARTPVLKRQATLNAASPRGKMLGESALPQIVKSSRLKPSISDVALSPLGIVRAEVKMSQLGTVLSDSIKDAFQMEFLDEPANQLGSSHKSLHKLDRLSSSDGSKHQQKTSDVPVFSHPSLLDPMDLKKKTDSRSVLQEDVTGRKNKLSRLFSPKNEIRLGFDLKTPQSTRVRYQQSFGSAKDHQSSDTGSQFLLPVIGKHNYSEIQLGGKSTGKGLSKLHTPKGYLVSEDTHASSAPQSVISLQANSILSKCEDALLIRTGEGGPNAVGGGTRMFAKVEKLYKLRNPKSWRKVLSPDVLEDIKIALEERRRLKETGAIIL